MMNAVVIGFLLLDQRDRPTRVWTWLAGDVDAGRYLPSFVRPSEADAKVAVVWLSTLALLLGLEDPVAESPLDHADAAPHPARRRVPAAQRIGEARGAMPKRSQPNQWPVRPKPQITSSAISSTSCRRQMRWTSGQ